jgi:hypothetical protein
VQLCQHCVLCRHDGAARRRYRHLCLMLPVSTPEMVDKAKWDAIRQLECDAAKCAAHELREAIQIHLHVKHRAFQ